MRSFSAPPPAWLTAKSRPYVGSLWLGTRIERLQHPKGGRPPRRWQVNPQIGVPVAETVQTAQTPLQPNSAVSAVSASQSVFTANGGADPLPEQGGDDLDDDPGDLRRCDHCGRLGTMANPLHPWD